LVLNDLNVYSILQKVQRKVIDGFELILKTSRFGRVKGVYVWLGRTVWVVRTEDRQQSTFWTCTLPCTQLSYNLNNSIYWRTV